MTNLLLKVSKAVSIKFKLVKINFKKNIKFYDSKFWIVKNILNLSIYKNCSILQQLHTNNNLNVNHDFYVYL